MMISVPMPTHMFAYMPCGGSQGLVTIRIPTALQLGIIVVVGMFLFLLCFFFHLVLCIGEICLVSDSVYKFNSSNRFV